MAMESEDAAVEAVRLTLLDSFAALPAARLTSSPQFIEWLVKILCTKIRHINKTGGEDVYKRQTMHSISLFHRIYRSTTHNISLFHRKYRRIMHSISQMCIRDRVRTRYP